MGASTLSLSGGEPYPGVLQKSFDERTVKVVVKAKVINRLSLSAMNCAITYL
jgi:hypothetical protein